ncbi:stereocilin-like [Rhinatrema bivittatum]|nr:stereocilin-like [Rhinatrema bivittatum]
MAGSDCNSLKSIVTNETIIQILSFFRNLSVLLDTYLKNCIVEELKNFFLSASLLERMGAAIAVQLPLSRIKRLSVGSTISLKKLLLNDPQYFLELSATKRALLIENMIQKLGISSGRISAAEYSSLGMLAPFVNGEIFSNISRRFLKQNLESMKAFCFETEKKSLLANMMQEQEMFGPSYSWSSLVLDHVERLLFFLPIESILDLGRDIMTKERVVLLFHSEHAWEASPLGASCVKNLGKPAAEDQFYKKQIVVQNFLGMQEVRKTSRAAADSLLPSCTDVKATGPSMWDVDSLTKMTTENFVNCLEVFGQDLHFSSGDLSVLLDKVREVFGPVSAMPAKFIAQLGRIASSCSDSELEKVRLSDLGTVAALSGVPDWRPSQLSILFRNFLNTSQRSVSDLDSVQLVALGDIICGMKTSDIAKIKPEEFCKAVLYIGSLQLSCTEVQLEMLTRLLTYSHTFGPVSDWKAEIFIEIGSLAAGLQDIELSSLVKEQIEGLSPRALALLPPKKFSVVFSADQIQMFNYNQAAAVTGSQISYLDPQQQKALSNVLTSWDDWLVDFRGRSAGVLWEPSLAFLLGILLVQC